MEFLDVFYCIITILVLLVLVCFAGAGLVDCISDALRNRQSKNKKYYDKLKRVLQKSIREIGKRDTLSNLRIAIHCTDGLEELKGNLEELHEQNTKIFDLQRKNIRLQAEIDTLNAMISKKAELDEKLKTKSKGKK